MKRFLAIAVLIASVMYSHVTTAGLSTGPSGTNNISGTLFSALDATNVVTGMANYGLVDGTIFVRTNDINGLNNALTNLAVATNKMMVGGGRIILQHGVHYITTAFFYTNEWPANVTIEGEGMPGANVVYVGPSTNVNIFRFIGNNAHDGVLLQVDIHRVQFASIWDTTNFIMEVKQAGRTYFQGCSWVPWTIATNNLNRGLAVSEDEATTSFTNLGGLYLNQCTGAGNTLDGCYFKWLQNGVWDGTDHILIHDTYFSLIATNGTSTGWPTNSFLRLGAAYIRDGTGVNILQTTIFNNHFTRDNICILDNDGVGLSKNVIVGKSEDCTWRYVSLKPTGNAFTFENMISGAPDGIGGISGTSYALTNSFPRIATIGKRGEVDTSSLLLYPRLNFGASVDNAGNVITTGTNEMRAIYQLVNLDSGYFRVTGGEAGYNGVYLFKEQDQNFLARADWRTVWTNTANTNTIVYDTHGPVPWGLYTVTNDFDTAPYVSDSFSFDPPPSTFDQNTGASNSITVTFIAGKFQVLPNGDVQAGTATLSSNLIVTGSISGNGSGLTNSAAVTPTDFVSGHFYTNTTKCAIQVSATINLMVTNTGTGGNGQASMTLYIDTAGGRSLLSLSNRVAIPQVPSNAGAPHATNDLYLAGVVGPGQSYCFSNTCASTTPGGTFNTVSVRPSTGQILRLP